MIATGRVDEELPAAPEPLDVRLGVQELGLEAEQRH